MTQELIILGESGSGSPDPGAQIWESESGNLNLIHTGNRYMWHMHIIYVHIHMKHTWCTWYTYDIHMIYTWYAPTGEFNSFISQGEVLRYQTSWWTLNDTSRTLYDVLRTFNDTTKDLLRRQGSAARAESFAIKQPDERWTWAMLDVSDAGSERCWMPAVEHPCAWT